MLLTGTGAGAGGRAGIGAAARANPPYAVIFATLLNPFINKQSITYSYYLPINHFVNSAFISGMPVSKHVADSKARITSTSAAKILSQSTAMN